MLICLKLYATLLDKCPDIRHHFLKNHVQKRNSSLEFVSTENQLAHNFTKPLPPEHFWEIRREVGNSELPY